METRRASLFAGTRAAAPSVLGMLPFAPICGTVPVAHGLSPARAAGLAARQGLQALPARPASRGSAP